MREQPEASMVRMCAARQEVHVEVWIEGEVYPKGYTGDWAGLLRFLKALQSSHDLR